MNINIIIKEEFEQFLDEEYPSSFNMDYFKSLNSFNKRILYCEEHLRRISSGSSRIVYQIDDEKVLKLSKNQKGIAQNEVEISFSEDSYINYLFAKVHDYHDDYLWLEMELCKKITFGRFEQLTGVKFRDFKDIINYEASLNNGRFKRSKPELSYDYWENEFVVGIIDYFKNYNIPHGDLIRISSYGENKNGEVVLVDFGLDQDTFDTHYSRKK